jgi:hypothetical protein
MKKYPNEFQMYFKDPATRACFISDIPPLRKGECPNCSGAGFLYIFVATSGPFREPSQNKINHWDNGWWVGKTYQGLCPVCQNNAYKPEQQNEEEEHILASRWDLKKD